MTFISRRRMRVARGVLPLAALLGLARCAEPAPAPGGIRTLAPAAAAPQAPTLPAAPEAARAAPVGQNPAGPDGARPVLFNDPPAPPDTPLCGRQAQEARAIGATLQAERLPASGICASFACYDPLTATYIGADGYRHVCR